MQSIFLPRITLNPPCQRRLGPCGWQRRRTCRKVPPTLPLLGIHHQLCVVPCAVIEKTGDQSPGLENRRIILAALSTPAFFCAFTGVAPVVNAAAPAASSIAYLIDQANPRDTVVVPAGVYQEKLTISKPLILEAGTPGEVEVVWQTEDHYEPVLTCESAEGVVVKGLRLKHASPSVANNYAVFLQGGSVTLEDCTITSSTGSGVAAEGGEHVIRRCRLFGCERHGLAVFGTLDGDGCQVMVERSSLEGNKLDGVLVRDQGSVELAGTCRVEGNGDHGVAVTYGSATISRAVNMVKNKKGNVFEGPGSDIAYV